LSWQYAAKLLRILYRFMAGRSLRSATTRGTGVQHGSEMAAISFRIEMKLSPARRQSRSAVNRAKYGLAG
jgi:hypothetical protein